jgi:hypothetical protein
MGAPSGQSGKRWGAAGGWRTVVAIPERSNLGRRWKRLWNEKIEAELNHGPRHRGERQRRPAGWGGAKVEVFVGVGGGMLAEGSIGMSMLCVPDPMLMR